MSVPAGTDGQPFLPNPIHTHALTTRTHAPLQGLEGDLGDSGPVAGTGAGGSGGGGDVITIADEDDDTEEGELPEEEDGELPGGGGSDDGIDGNATFPPPTPLP